MFQMFYFNRASSSAYMARALTSGAGAGSALALLLHSFDRADREHHQLIEKCLGPYDWHFLLYPVLEALLAYRWFVLQTVLSRVVRADHPLRQTQRPSFRIL